MAMTVPAIKGQMGSNVYYETKMRAQELVQAARVASERDTWASLSIDERLQRDLNKKRVREEIVPYLAKSKDRFFGSVIVLIEDAEIDFESAGKYLAKDVPAAYRKTFEHTGALTIDGGKFIIIDGQHRWAALRAVITGQDDQGNSVIGPEVGEVPDDELMVIFLPFSSLETTRRIFNKINRNAKPTGRSDNIITSEDDGNAIIARKLLSSGEPLGTTRSNTELIVNWKSTTISPRSAQWTTISAVHTTVIDILKHAKIQFAEKHDVVRPEEERLEEAYEIVKEWWMDLVDRVDAFKAVIAKPDEIPQIRDTHDEWALLLKPAIHMVIVKALIKAVERGVDRNKAIARLNQVDWHLDADLWQGIMILPSGRIVARAENYDVSAELLAYLIGPEVMDDAAKKALQEKVAKFRGGEYTLPSLV